LTPQFQITANDVDLTSKIAARLIRLRITDEVGVTSDQLQIDLDDRDAAIVLPPFGATLECSLGYKESGLSGGHLHRISEIWRKDNSIEPD